MSLLRNKILFFDIALYFIFGAFLCLICIYGVDNADSGYVLSYIERLDMGQLPYQDFDLVRPFGNVIFWDLLLSSVSKDSYYLLLIARGITVIQYLLSSYVISCLIFPKQSRALSTLLISILLMHTFPIMPWHTTDGIFWGVLAIWCLKKEWFLSAIILAIFAISSKQSFYFFGGCVVVFSMYKSYKNNFAVRKNDILTFAILSSIALYAALKYDLISNLPLIIQQTKSDNALSQLYKSGIKSYFFNTFLANLFFIGLLLMLYYQKKIVSKNVVFIITTVLIVGFYITPLFTKGSYHYANQLFVLFLALQLRYHPKDLIGYWLLFLAWSSSLSWGYNQPTLLLGIIYLYLFKEYFTPSALRIGSISLIFVMFGIRINFPYFNDNLFRTKYVYCRDIPIISGLLMTQKDYDYYKESLEVSKTYKNIIFLPGSPLLDVINNTFNNRASWEMDVEYPNYVIDLNNKNKETIYAVEKKPTIPYEKGFFKSSYTNEIISRTKKIDSTTYFNIYQ